MTRVVSVKGFDAELVRRMTPSQMLEKTVRDTEARRFVSTPVELEIMSVAEGVERQRALEITRLSRELIYTPSGKIYVAVIAREVDIYV